MALSKVPYTDYQTVVTAANMNAIQDEIISTTSLALCNTAPGTAAKSATLLNFVLSTGAAVKVKFADSNTAANPTLNINSTGAQAIMQYGGTPVGTTPNTSWNAGDVVELVYDGTNWVIVGKNLQEASSTQAGLLSAADKGVIDTVGDVSDLDTTAKSTVVDAVNELHGKTVNNDLFFSGVTVSATSGTIVTINDSRITTDHILARYEFANNAAITAPTAWNTNTAGRLTISGTCTSATTAEIVLVKKDN